MKHSIRLIIYALAISAMVLVAGCEGSESKKAITDTVETLSGADAVKKGEKIKNQLKEFEKQEAQRAQAGLEETSTGVSPEQGGQ